MRQFGEPHAGQGQRSGAGNRCAFSIGRIACQITAATISRELAAGKRGVGVRVSIARGLSGFLVSFLNTDGNPASLTEPDWRVLAFTTGLAVLTCLLFGLGLRYEQWHQSWRSNEAGSRGLTASRERFGLRRILVVAQLPSLWSCWWALFFFRAACATC